MSEPETHRIVEHAHGRLDPIDAEATAAVQRRECRGCKARLYEIRRMEGISSVECAACHRFWSTHISMLASWWKKGAGVDSA